MKRLLIVAALVLTGCNQGGDPSICTPIFKASTPASSAEALERQNDIGWQSNRANACVHRMAYRLAASNDPAETVARAVLAACSEPIATSVESTAQHMQRVFNRTDQESYDQTVAQFTRQFEGEALAKVVEGRAGKCKA